MRQKKADNVKSVCMTVSVPQSVRAYLLDDCNDPSFTIQRWVAERVLGQIMEAHYITYAGPRDIRFKPESLKKSYIRMLRWILESRIARAWQSDKLVTLEVDWLLTGKTGMLCQIDLAISPGFVHVIYDREVTEPVGVETDYVVEPPELSSFSARYKWTVVRAWLAHSRGA